MIRLWTLGSLDLRDGENREIRPILSQPKRLALLAYLATPGSREFHRRDELLAVFWPEHDQERARAALNRAIYYLRQSLGSSVIVSRGDDEIALASDAIWCDAAAFEEAIVAKDHARALALYRGDFLTGFFVSDLRGLEHWFENQRTRLKALAARAARALADSEDAANNVVAAVACAERAVALAPFDEAAFRRYLVLLDRTGDRAGAVRAYEDFSRRIALELELTPAPETQALVDTIRERTQPLTPSAPSQTVASNGATAGAATASVSPVERPASSRVRKTSILAVGLGLVALAAGMGLRWARPVERGRVVVAVFANRTGDSTLDPLGALAADVVTQSLVQTGLVPKVAQPVALGLLHSDGGSDAAEIERLGRSARAATVVAGAFYRDGDSIRFNARIVDLERSHVVWAVQPIVTTADSARAAIEQIAQRTSGAVAVLMDPRFAPWLPIASPPPTFAAFQEHARGVELHRLYDHTTAVKHYLRAIEIDTSFAWARVELAMALRDLFQHKAADSIADALSETRDKATPLLGQWLDWMQAMRAEDYVRAYRVMQRAAALAPERFQLSLAQAADRINRPNEALAALDSLGTKNPYNGSPAYWSLLTKSLHQLGRHQRELEAARQAQRGNPENVSAAVAYEIRALTALGQVDGVPARLAKIFAYAHEDSRDVGLWEYRGITMVLIDLVEELRVHGHPEIAARTIDDLIAWHRRLPAKEANTQERRGELGRALYQGKRWDEAEAVFRALKHDFPKDAVVNTGYLGAIAAQRGDRARAEQAIAELEAMKPKAVRREMQTSYWQAKIAALLGDRENAVRHLVDLLGQEGRYMHPSSDLETLLRGYPPFEELYRPKG